MSRKLWAQPVLHICRFLLGIACCQCVMYILLSAHFVHVSLKVGIWGGSTSNIMLLLSKLSRNMTYKLQQRSYTGIYTLTLHVVSYRTTFVGISQIWSYETGLERSRGCTQRISDKKSCYHGPVQIQPPTLWSVSKSMSTFCTIKLSTRRSQSISKTYFGTSILVLFPFTLPPRLKS